MFCTSCPSLYLFVFLTTLQLVACTGMTFLNVPVHTCLRTILRNLTLCVFQTDAMLYLVHSCLRQSLVVKLLRHVRDDWSHSRGLFLFKHSCQMCDWSCPIQRGEEADGRLRSQMYWLYIGEVKMTQMHFHHKTDTHCGVVI